MCKIIGESKRKTVTGYKLAYEINDSFYSPYTGVQYRVGKVHATNKVLKEANSISTGRFLSEFDDYEPQMTGKTAVFLKKEDAKKELLILNDTSKYSIIVINVVMLKMKISGNLLDAKFKEARTIAGDSIESIEKI